MNSHLHLTARLHDYEQRKREQEDTSIDILCVDAGNGDREGGRVDVIEVPTLAEEEEEEGEADVEADGEQKARHWVGRGEDVVDELDFLRENMMMAMEGTEECSLGSDEAATVEADTSNGIEDLDVSSELNRLLEGKERGEREGRRDS